MYIISVRIPRVCFKDGHVSTDALQQTIHRGLWNLYGVMPAPVRVSLHDGHAIMSSGCEAGDVETILKLVVNHV